MRVLVTGMTTLQVGRHGQLNITSFAHLLPAALAAAGHEVEHRPVEPGEPLGSYDAALVGIIGPGSQTARNSYRCGALDAIGRANAEGCGLGFYLDDADLARIDKDLRYLLKDDSNLNSHMERDKHYAWAEANLGHLWAVS